MDEIKPSVGEWMRSNRTVREYDCYRQSRNSPGFHPSILRHSEIWGAKDEAVLNNIHSTLYPTQLCTTSLYFLYFSLFTISPIQCTCMYNLYMYSFCIPISYPSFFSTPSPFLITNISSFLFSILLPISTFLYIPFSSFYYTPPFLSASCFTLLMLSSRPIFHLLSHSLLLPTSPICFSLFAPLS